jgi:proteasome accessory factor A
MSPVVGWYLTRKLAPFLVTRQILAGAGSLFFNKLVISGRSRFIDLLVSAVTTLSSAPQRAVINTKYEPLGNVPRLHLIVGDCNMCEVANLLKIGTTSLVLRLIEDGVVVNSALDLLEASDAPWVLKRISEDLTCHEPLLTLASGETVSAYELQRRYFETAAREYPRAGDSDKEKRSAEEVLALWGEVLDHLRDGDMWKLVGVLDWPTKFMAAKQALRKYGLKLADFPRGIAAHSRRKEIAHDLCRLEQNYHELSADGYYYRLCKSGAVHRVISDKIVTRLASFAPSDTRAMARMLLIRFAEKYRERYLIARANWEEVVIEDLVRPLEHILRKQKFALADPFKAVPLPVAKFLRHNGKKKPRR